MRNYITGFPAQLEEALRIAASFELKGIEKNRISNIIISGLGGSGISGTIISELVADTCPVSVTVNKDYSLPAFADGKTLLIACSYSGNTEETIAVLSTAIEKKCQTICISSGGTITEIATAHSIPVVKIPGGHPPRASFGYPFVQLLNIFDQLNFSEKGFRQQLEKFISSARTNAALIEKNSMDLAHKLLGKVPVIYCISGNEGVAIRFRQQINENSKMLCWHQVIPEMNHNELVGWVEKNEQYAVIALRTSYDFSRSVKRLEICKSIITPFVSSFTELFASGDSKLEQALHLIHFTDWVSVHLATLKNIDPVEVNVINRLKDELSKF